MSAAPDRGFSEPAGGFPRLLDELVAELAAAEAADAADRDDEAEALLLAAEWSVRHASGRPLPRPFHHAYLTPVATPVIPPPPGKLDVRF